MSGYETYLELKQVLVFDIWVEIANALSKLIEVVLGNKDCNCEFGKWAQQRSVEVRRQEKIPK